MSRLSPVLTLPALALCAAALWPCTALAGDPQVATQTTEKNGEAAAQAKSGGKPTFVVLPIPESNPSLGSGLTVAGVALYEPARSGGVWTTGAGALYTDTKSWGFGVFQKLHLDDDRFRSSAAAGYADLNLDFYGVGAGAGDRNIAIPINQKGTFAFVEGLFRVMPHLHVGPRYRFLTLETSVDLPPADLPKYPDILIDLPPIQLHSQVSGLGITGEYDTRDTEYGPSHGLYATAAWLWNSAALGSDFNYNKVDVSVNAYNKLGPGVLALRGSVCAASENAPFYDLCNYGQSNDLRGYAAGQYRDRAMWAVQTEYRMPLFWRFGAVVFGGVGGIAPGLGHLGDSTVLPAAGVGLRLAASEKYKVNISVDMAWGQDSHATYFYIGEAF